MGILMSCGQNSGKQNEEHFLKHKMGLEIQEEEMWRIPERRTKGIISLWENLKKKWPDFCQVAIHFHSAYTWPKALLYSFSAPEE